MLYPPVYCNKDCHKFKLIVTTSVESKFLPKIRFSYTSIFQVKLKTETNMDPTPAISQKKSLLKLLTRTPKKTDISRPLVRVDSVPRQSQECTARSRLCAVCKVYAPGFGRALRASWHQACRVVRFVTLYRTLSSAPVSSFLLLHCANVDCIHHTPVKAGATSRRKRRTLLLIGALS